MKVLFVASECAPLAKVGGLADVVGSLPKTLKKLSIDVSIVLPFYEIISRKDKNLKLLLKDIPVSFEDSEKKFSLWQTLLPDSKVPVFLIENKEYFKGKGVYIEADASSGGTKAEAARFLFLSVATIKIAEMMKTQIIHCHDWHVATIPYLVKERKLKDFKVFLTIHNLGYQGVYSKKIFNELLGTNLKEEVNCLKLGILTANLISTVSPNYSKEILTKEYGSGLEKYLKERKNDLVGIVNGIDTKTWNPSTDQYIKSAYSLKTLNKKQINKDHLQKKFFKNTKPDTLLLGIVSRLAEQKGFDLLEKIFPDLMKENIRFIILGSGDPRYQKLLESTAKKYPDKLGIKIGYDNKLAHQIYAGSDTFLMPSSFEPCGLGQIIAMRYGTIPVVRETGGLKDTVLPFKNKNGKVSGNGFLFKNYEAKEFLKTIHDSLRVYKKKDVWKKLQINGMKKDFSWKKSAKEYIKIYNKL